MGSFWWESTQTHSHGEMHPARHVAMGTNHRRLTSRAQKSFTSTKGATWQGIQPFTQPRRDELGRRVRAQVVGNGGGNGVVTECKQPPTYRVHKRHVDFVRQHLQAGEAPKVANEVVGVWPRECLCSQGVGGKHGAALSRSVRHCAEALIKLSRWGSGIGMGTQWGGGVCRGERGMAPPTAVYIKLQGPAVSTWS
jgi:hypothetical protein